MMIDAGLEIARAANLPEPLLEGLIRRCAIATVPVQSARRDLLEARAIALRDGKQEYLLRIESALAAL